jgi:hypothetical protein
MLNVIMLCHYAEHRYLKNIDCLSFDVCLLLVPHLFFFAAAIDSTNEANKAGGTHH